MENGREKNTDQSNDQSNAEELQRERDRDADRNTERPAGDWSVVPDPVEPNKPGQQIEDPRYENDSGAV